jgi:outer membrane protein assembly factor BamB
MNLSNNRNSKFLILASLLLMSVGTAAWFLIPTNGLESKSLITKKNKVKEKSKFPDPLEIAFKDENGKDFNVKIINQTYLSNEKRNYYGDKLPSKLEVIWQLNLGGGPTQVGATKKHWSGAGWTGQPLMVLENGRKYIIQGAFDHRLKKIDYETGEVIWQYRFDDVVKGTGSLWINHKADSLKDRLVILQGTRAGSIMGSPVVDCYRGISYFTGEELWRMNSPRTACYSRDVDGSALLINDTAYLALETGIFAVFNPDRRAGSLREGLFQPHCYRFKDTLYRPKDAQSHGGNLVSEASPARLRDHVYIASGSGRVWGYNMYEQKMDWEYFIGSDIDGSPVVTDDSCLLISVEKQFIAGQGGILKIDPSKNPEDATVWYLPTGNQRFVTWDGGVIGSAATNEATRSKNQPHIGAAVAIDGYTYVFDLNKIDSSKKVKLFDAKTEAATPLIYFKYKTGPSISTPIIVGNRLAVPCYEKFYLFEFNDKMEFKLLDTMNFSAEATPFCDNGRIFVASRNGYLYCLGESNGAKPRTIQLSYDTEVNSKNPKKKKEEPKNPSKATVTEPKEEK